MALFEAVANVVTRYKADVSDNIKGLQKLKGEERSRAEALLEQHRKANEALENQIKGYQKIAGGVVLLAAGFAAATKGLDAYAKTSDEAKKKVEQLKESTSKAFDAMYAGIGETVMALSPLIEGVAGLITLLDKVGLAGPAAIAALGFAITKNPKVAALLAAVALAMEAGGAIKDYSKEFTAGGGVQASQGAVSGVYGGYGNYQTPAQRAATEKAERDAALTVRVGASVVGWIDDAAKAAEKLNAAIGRLTAADPWRGDVKPPSKDKDKARAKEGPLRSYVGGVSTDYDFGGSMGSTSLGAKADSVPRDEFGREIMLDVNAPYQKLVDAEKSRQATVLEGMFGPIEEFDAYAEGFSMLSGAATAAYDALVDGNVSAGAAMKAFLRESIKGLGSRMLMRSLEETAEGIAALSSPLTAAAAPAHFAAAKMFAVGAVTAGVIASQMGGGGGGGGGGGASASLPRDMGTGRDQYDGGKSKVIIIGDPMSDDSPRYKARNVDRMLNMAVRTSAGRYA